MDHRVVRSAGQEVRAPRLRILHAAQSRVVRIDNNQRKGGEMARTNYQFEKRKKDLAKKKKKEEKRLRKLAKKAEDNPEQAVDAEQAEAPEVAAP